MTYVNIKKLKQRRSTGWNRETQRQINFFRKTLQKHMDNKPEFNVDGTDEERAEQQTKIMQWATSYGNIVKKLRDLGYEFNGDNERIHKQSVEQGELVRQRLQESGRTETRDMQDLLNIGQETNGMSKG